MAPVLQLTNLTQLSMRAEELPPNTSDLSQLQQLTLVIFDPEAPLGQPLTGGMQQIAQLSQLTQLSLDFGLTMCTSEIPVPHNTALSSLSLKVQQNIISSYGISSSLAELTQLMHLALNMCCGSIVLQQLAGMLSSVSSMESLDLHMIGYPEVEDSKALVEAVVLRQRPFSFVCVDLSSFPDNTGLSGWSERVQQAWRDLLRQQQQWQEQQVAAAQVRILQDVGSQHCIQVGFKHDNTYDEYP
uniref:Uncharacterized protein n=1 Tax=Tetradesmus obliquus TaxID=3088 RepID=A0A383VPL5_TETOB|eukprot:jgi/Sobl393_1/18279/SZX77876.1